MINSSVINLADAAALAVAVVDVNGDQISGFDTSRPANATTTTVPSNIASVVLQAANPARRQIIILNVGNKVLSVNFGPTATIAGAAFSLGANASYEGPLNGYTGVISGIWNNANGHANVTEVTT